MRSGSQHALPESTRCEPCSSSSGSFSELTATACESTMVESLLRIPGLGLLTATALFATIGDIHAFKSGRQLACWLGLTPRESSSGARRRLGIHGKGGRSAIGVKPVTDLARRGPAFGWLPMREFHDGPEPCALHNRGRIYDCSRFTLPGSTTHYALHGCPDDESTCDPGGVHLCQLSGVAPLASNAPPSKPTSILERVRTQQRIIRAAPT